MSGPAPDILFHGIYAVTLVMLAFHWLGAFLKRKKLKTHWPRYLLLVVASALAVSALVADYYYQPIVLAFFVFLFVFITLPGFCLAATPGIWRLELWKAARWRLRLAAILDPTRPTRQFAKLAVAVEREASGSGIALIESFANDPDVGVIALTFLGTFGDHWEDVIARTEDHPAKASAAIRTVRARALGEVGRREEILAIAEAWGAFNRRNPYDKALLTYVAAFYGQREFFDRAWLRAFTITPWRRDYWRTTADLYSGGEAERNARRRFQSPAFEKYRRSLGALERRRHATVKAPTDDECRRLDALAAKVPDDPREPRVYR